MEKSARLNMLRDWVEPLDPGRSLSQNHGERRHLQRLWLIRFPIRLVDVRYGNLVIVSAAVELIALSYVWGRFKQFLLIS